MTPSPAMGSLEPQNVSWLPLAALMAAHSNQFASTSRDRIPPNLLNGLPLSRCLPFRTNGSSSFSATSRLLKCVTGYFMAWLGQNGDPQSAQRQRLRDSDFARRSVDARAYMHRLHRPLA